MNAIEELYQLLNDDGIDIDTIELVESLWLSQYISKTEIASSVDNDTNKKVDEKPIKKDINSSPIKNESPKNTTKVGQTKQDKRKDAPLHPIGDENNEHSLPFRTPTIRKLYKDNDLIYAFRHFRQKIVSLKQLKLDEEKVADYMASTDIFRPFYKKSYEKKFNILFIVDLSDSMNIWESLIEDFIKDVKNYHIFKKVLVYYVDTNDEIPKYSKKKEKLSKLNSRWYISTEPNTLVFMFSDMISKSWSSGKLIDEIFLWQKYFHFSIVQMLPQRLWNGTKLIDASIGKMRSRKKFMDNTQLLSRMEERLRLEGENISELVKIPLLSFDENAIDAYGKVIRSLPSNKIEGALFEKEDFQGEYEFSERDNNLKAEDKLRSFYKYASTTSKELLELLAIVPLSLPIIKLVQKKLLLSSTQEHLSEIFMSSIFDKEQKIEGFYQFYKAKNEDSGVREQLIKKIGAKKAFQTIVKISEVIQKQGGVFDFLAYIVDPAQLKKSQNFSEIDREFARISVSVLNEMGGEYRDLADKLKNGYVFDEYKYGSVKKLVNKPLKSIRVIGVGGGGGNMINHMIQEGINDIDLIVANTDAQALDSSLAPYKLQLGISATRGLGAGMLPDKGREAALESFEEIKAILDGSDMVFISAGLDGGTGTGAASIIVQAAKEVGAFVVSIVTTPFRFEGSKRIELAKKGLEELKRESDSIIVVPNEKLLSVVDKNLGIKESFRMVDDILAKAVGSIAKVILTHGENDIIPDLADVKMILSYSGIGYIGTGYSAGTNAAYDAAKSAIESPLLENVPIDTAMGVLVHFDIHPDLPIMEIGEAMRLIEESADEEASVFFGTTANENMDIDEVGVTIIATGVEKVSEVDIINNVVKQLKHQGWDDSNIVQEYKIANKYRTDIVLMQENKPVAVVEIKYSLNNENMDKAINQVVSYAEELNVSVAYISDGKKIYEYDIPRKNYELVKRYPSGIDLEEKILAIKKRKYLTSLPSLNIKGMDYYLENEKQIQDFSYSINERNFVVLNGNAGVGKTTFIINFINKKEQHYDYIAYIKNIDNFFRNLKDQLLEGMSFDVEDTIDDIINKLSLLEGNKILVLDDVDDDVAKYEDYLIKLAEANWKIILISRVEYFNFKRIGEEVQNDIYYHRLYPHTYEELSTLFKKSIISNSYPKTGKVFTILDGLTDKKLLQVGSGLSNDFEILALADLHEVFTDNGIRSTRVLSYYEGRPNIVDMIMDSEIDFVILQISPNMTKDELHHIFMIFQTAQQNDVPLIVDTKQLDKFISDLTLVYYECIECDRLDTFTCNELEWETISGAERNMGHESEYQAIYEDTCSKCNNEIEIKLSCWEYPIGAEDTRDIKARGARIIQGDCCPDFHNDYGEEPTEDDEYSNLKRDTEIKEMEEKEFDDFIGQTIEDNNTTNNSLKINKRWWGNWEAGKDRNWFEQDLSITRVDENGFDFELICINGSHIGEINGYAKFISPNEAKFENTEEDEKETCRLYFHKINETMKITEENCSEYHGLQAYFDGNYELKKDVFVKYNEIADDRVLSEIYSLIGKKYWGKFQQCFSGIRGMDDLDNLGVNIITGTVPGLNSIQESIIMVDEVKNIWGSFINDEDDRVYYFTSVVEWKKKLPLTVESWRKNFKDKELVFIDDLLIKDNVYHGFDDEDELENDTFSKIVNRKMDNDYNLLIIDTNLEQLNIIKNSFENKGFESDRLFPTSIESKKFIRDIQVLADNTNILKLRDYIIQSIKNFNIHALVIEPVLSNEEISHPNDTIGSKVIAELEKIKEFEQLPILVLSQLRKYSMVDNVIVSDNILLAEKPYAMNVENINQVLDEDIMSELYTKIINYVEFKKEEYVDSVIDTKIHVPANGKVYEFEVNDKYYDINIHKISEQAMNESQATREMVNQTGATHQGTIKLKDNKHGNIEELNKLIEEIFDKEYGLAFYSIINDEQEKEDYIDFVKAESEMEGWFSENYDDPANFLPHETREGGYQYLYGGPYELDEILYEEFGEKYPAEYIKQVIEGLEHQHGDIRWAKKYNQDIEKMIKKWLEDRYNKTNIMHTGFNDIQTIVFEKFGNKYHKATLIKICTDIKNIHGDVGWSQKNGNLNNDDIKTISRIDGEFTGWHGDTILKLTNGQLWKQAEYYIEVNKSFNPSVIITNSKTGHKIQVDGINKEVGVFKLSLAKYLEYKNTDYIESQIDGEFTGWDGETIFKLLNGQVWKQSSYAYRYTYKFMPKVTIYKSDYGFKLKVEGDNESIEVERIE